jgi:hypothetical protein
MGFSASSPAPPSPSSHPSACLAGPSCASTCWLLSDTRSDPRPSRTGLQNLTAVFIFPSYAWYLSLHSPELWSYLSSLSALHFQPSLGFPTPLGHPACLIMLQNSVPTLKISLNTYRPEELALPLSFLLLMSLLFLHISHKIRLFMCQSSPRSKSRCCAFLSLCLQCYIP